MLEEMAEERFALCIPTRRCYRSTPYGEVEGMECPVTDEVFHNTTVDGLGKIAETGAIAVISKEFLGQDAVSVSSCPSQHYGGNVKLVIDAKGLPLRPMCYYQWEENKAVDSGISKEASEPIDGIAGENRVRAKYGVNLDMYKEECESVSYDEIPASKIKKVEFWIPWKVDEWRSFSTRCKNSMPAYAHADVDSVKAVMNNISSTKKLAEKIGIPFEVKSCFTALRTGFWEKEYIPLTKENMAKMARGEIPLAQRGAIPEKCLC